MGVIAVDNAHQTREVFGDSLLFHLPTLRARVMVQNTRVYCAMMLSLAEPVLFACLPCVGFHPGPNLVGLQDIGYEEVHKRMRYRCIGVTCVDPNRAQKRLSVPLELELQAVVSDPAWLPGRELWSSGRAASTPISPALG